MKIYNESNDYDFYNNTSTEENPEPDIMIIFLAICFSCIFLCACCGDFCTDMANCFVQIKCHNCFTCVCKIFRKRENLIVEIDKKPIKYYTIENSYFSRKDCPVCFENTKQLVRLKCSHFFCKECMDNWLEISKTCPLCRADVL